MEVRAREDDTKNKAVDKRSVFHVHMYQLPKRGSAVCYTVLCFVVIDCYVVGVVVAADRAAAALCAR